MNAYLTYFKHCMIYTIAILFSIASLPTMAEIRLQLSEGNSLLALNGLELDKTLRHKSPALVLHNGTHQMLVQHTAEIETSDGDEIYEKTELFVILFSASDTQLTLSTSPITSLAALDTFNKAPQWRLLNEQGQAVPIKSSALLKEGVQFGRNFEQELATFNRSQHPGAHPGLATLKVDRATVIATPIKIAPQAKQATDTNTATLPPVGISYRTLVELYQQAGPEVQQRFKQWLKP